MSDEPRQCDVCAAPLAPDQRYCLTCGERSGSRGQLMLALLQRVAGGAGDPGTEEPGVSAAPVTAAPARTPSHGLRLPRPRISALLVLLFLGFGAFLGSAASPRSGALSAAVSPRLKLVLPAHASSSGSSGGSGGGSSSSSESSAEPPQAEEQPTPEPAASSGATKTAASSGSPSTGKESGQEHGGGGEQGAPAKKLPAIRHVFLIVLSDEPYAAAFGPESKARYLAHTLEGKGELLVRYDAVAHEELANEIALLSGQGPTVQTAGNCPTYEDLAAKGAGADGQVLGEGCIYPAGTQTLMSQLAAKHLSWRAYVQGIDEPGSSQQQACARPALGAPDPSAEQAQSTGAYATFRNPFVYFDSILDGPSCAADDVGLSSLKKDLAKPASTPSFAYIAPDRCHDANPKPCTAGAPAGAADADGVLEAVVPEIMASPAYKQGGLIAITVDEAPSGGEYADSSSCCGQPSFPNVPSAPGPTGVPRGGGAVGALLISPFVKAATTSQEPYGHFSLLRTVEDLFKLHHLGYAALPAVKSFAPALFTAARTKG